MVEGEPTVPLLIYLHADRMIPQHHLLSSGTRVPCSGNVVETDELATLLLAAAFWSLRLRQLVAIETDTHDDVLVTPLEGSRPHGFEGEVLKNLDEAMTLREVVGRWSATRTTDPWHDVVHAVEAEALEAGYLHPPPDPGNVVARLLGGGHKLEADCERINALTTSFEAVATSWRSFRTEEPELHGSLLAHCRRSLLSCTECWYP